LPNYHFSLADWSVCLQLWPLLGPIDVCSLCLLSSALYPIGVVVLFKGHTTGYYSPVLSSIFAASFETDVWVVETDSVVGACPHCQHSTYKIATLYHLAFGISYTFSSLELLISRVLPLGIHEICSSINQRTVIFH